MRLVVAYDVYKILEECEIRKATTGNPLTDWEYGYNCGIERAEIEIECAPAVDAVPVIRCKDCTHWHTSYCPMAYLEYELGRGNEPMDFCSLAERKSDETERCGIDI